MKKILTLLILVINFMIVFKNVLIEVNATLPDQSLFGGLTYNTVSGGPLDGYRIVDNIERLYMIRYGGMANNYVLTHSLDFSSEDSYNNPDLFGDFNGDGVDRTILQDLTTGSGWLPLGGVPSGSSSASGGEFTGKLIGSGLITISGLVIQRNVGNNQSVGFIRQIGASAEVKNLHFHNMRFIISAVVGATSDKIVGGLAGTADPGTSHTTIIENIHLNGKLEFGGPEMSDRVRFGGIIGEQKADGILNITDSSVNLDLYLNPTIQNTTTGNNLNIGGIVAHSIGNLNISNTYFSGRLEGSAVSAGFVARANAPASTRTLNITNSYSNPIIITGHPFANAGFVGAIVAGSRRVNILNSYSAGKILQKHTGNKSISAGFIGTTTANYFSIRNSFTVLANPDGIYKGLGSSLYQSFVTQKIIENSYLINNIPTSGVHQDEVASNRFLLLAGIPEISSGLQQDNIIGSGSSSWNTTDGRLPLLKYSGLSELLPFQTTYGINQDVNYIMNGGTNNQSNPSSVDIINDTVELSSGTRDDYNFLGWYESPGFIGDPVTQIVPGSFGVRELFARWTPSVSYTITYNNLLDGTNNINNLSSYNLDTIPDPIILLAPTRNNYDFDGWFEDTLFETPITQFSTQRKENITLYAKWIPTNSYTITYNLNGGVNNIGNPSIYNIDSPTTITLLAPTRSGFAFDGWFENADLTTSPISSFANNRNENLTLYAKWILTSFSISFDSGPGTAVAPVSGNEGDAVGLPTPTLKDHRFDGWLNSEGQLVSNPYTMKNVNETFSATWTFVTFSPIRVRELIRELYLEVEPIGPFEYGEQIVYPTFNAWEEYGFVKTDLLEFVTREGTIGEAVGEYVLTYTLTYNDESIQEEVIVNVVDTTPPALSVVFPERVLYDQPVEPVITATDNAPGAVTVRAIKELDVNSYGTQLVMYEAEDALGNITQVVQQVRVELPEIRVQMASVNAQRFVFVLYDHLMDFTSMIMYMAQSVVEPMVDSPLWESYEAREFVAEGPGERVYLMMLDAIGNIISRESIELFYRAEPQLDQPIVSHTQTTTVVSWPLVGGFSLGGLSLGGVFLWFLKRRNQK